MSQIKVFIPHLLGGETRSWRFKHMNRIALGKGKWIPWSSSIRHWMRPYRRRISWQKRVWLHRVRPNWAWTYLLCILIPSTKHFRSTVPHTLAPLHLPSYGPRKKGHWNCLTVCACLRTSWLWLVFTRTESSTATYYLFNPPTLRH